MLRGPEVEETSPRVLRERARALALAVIYSEFNEIRIRLSRPSLYNAHARTHTRRAPETLVSGNNNYNDIPHLLVTSALYLQYSGERFKIIIITICKHVAAVAAGKNFLVFLEYFISFTCARGPRRMIVPGLEKRTTRSYYTHGGGYRSASPFDLCLF